MVAGGLGHTRTAFVAYGVMAISAGLALAVEHAPRERYAGSVAWPGWSAAPSCTSSGSDDSARHDEATLFDRTVGAGVTPVDARLRVRSWCGRVRLDRRLPAAVQPRGPGRLPCPRSAARSPWVVPIYAAAFLASGLYRGLLRFASLPDLFRIARAATLGGATVALVAYLLQLELPVPRSVIILSPLLLVMVMGGARAVYRDWRDGRQRSAGSGPRRPLVIIGAGDAAVALIRELQRAGEWRVVGLLDDDTTKHRRELLGHRVLGSLDELPRLYSELRGPGRDHRHAGSRRAQRASRPPPPACAPEYAA